MAEDEEVFVFVLVMMLFIDFFDSSGLHPVINKLTCGLGFLKFHFLYSNSGLHPVNRPALFEIRTVVVEKGEPLHEAPAANTREPDQNLRLCWLKTIHHPLLLPLLACCILLTESPPDFCHQYACKVKV